MILEELTKYYDRKANDPNCEDIARNGYSLEIIDYIVTLSQDGEIVNVSSLEYEEDIPFGNKTKKVKRSRRFIVPKLFFGKKGSKIQSNIFWDEIGYIVGYDKNPNRAKEKYYTFRKINNELLGNSDDEDIKSYLKFINNYPIGNIKPFTKFVSWDKLEKRKVTFKIDNLKREYLFEKPIVKEIATIYADSKNDNAYKAMCIITGENGEIAKLHNPISGIVGCAQQPNVLICYQQDKTAFSSYGKDGLQGYNAPITKETAFKYAAAANYLVNTAKQKIQIGDVTTIFWATQSHTLEKNIFNIFNSSLEFAEHDTQEYKDSLEFASYIKTLLESYKQGVKYSLHTNEDIAFNILGLSPNMARVAVSNWMQSNVRSIEDKIAMHYNDISIEKQFPTQFEYLSIITLLKSTALARDLKNISPMLSNSMFRSVIYGVRYPTALLSMVILRIKSEKYISYERCSLIKGILNRNYKRSLTVSLDPKNTNVSYLLGRLFAIIEKSQEDASVGNMNTTIKDKFFTSALTNPSKVFPALLKYAQHYISKSKYGYISDKRISDIMEIIDKFPINQNLEEQGIFITGYYHQKNSMYKKQESNIEETTKGV